MFFFVKLFIDIYQHINRFSPMGVYFEGLHHYYMGIYQLSEDSLEMQC